MFGFSTAFSVFSVIFVIGFFLVLGLIIFTAIKGAAEWNRNNRSPVLTVDARVVAKRTDVSHHHNDDMYHTHTTYYVTFEFESGDRLELRIPDGEFGYLTEGDYGKLTFQGTRFKGFKRYGETM